jgi:hypothetical protein
MATSDQPDLSPFQLEVARLFFAGRSVAGSRTGNGICACASGLAQLALPQAILLRTSSLPRAHLELLCQARADAEDRVRSR